MVGNEGWRAWAAQQSETRRSGDIIVCCAQSRNFAHLGAYYSANQAIRVFALEDSSREDETILLVTHALAKWSGSTKRGTHPVRLFISHAKVEHCGISGRTLAVALKQFVESRPAGQVFFDEVGIIGGEEFASSLEQQIDGATVIVLLTDKFSSRYWCGWEVATAKQKRCPVLVIDALHDGEPVSLGFLGKVPCLRWDAATDRQRNDPAMHRKIIAGALLETLRLMHESARALAVKALVFKTDPNIIATGTAPEMITLPEARAEEQTLVHPDPPLPRYELSAIRRQRRGLRLLSVTQALAGVDTNSTSPLQGIRVALSISDAPDQESNGITATFRDRLWAALNLHLILAGADVAYGGDLRTGGFTERLHDVARAADDAGRPLRVGSIHWYVGWPIAVRLSDAEKAAIPPAFRVHPLQQPPGFDPTHVPPPHPPVNMTAADHYAWTCAMTEMRGAMARECHARILVGGQFRAVSPWPGLLEEFETFIGKPIYLIGAFGGATRLLIDTLQGKIPSEFSSAFQDEEGKRKPLREYYETRVGVIDWAKRVQRIKSLDIDGLNNGLDRDENLHLFVTRDSTEMIALVLRGLGKVFARNSGLETRT
ncbi:MAG: hypothetical protein HYX75_13245 [Acidobacteria bacterium]|nr:hypothetical protein [Acidobacteriota bacterium]